RVSFCCKKEKRNMIKDDADDVLERRLLAELAEIDRKIGELTVERDSIRRILFRVKSGRSMKVDVTRKNSYNRIIVEFTIIEALKSSERPLSVRRLLFDAKSVVYGLKDGTFRSYLTRMKARGLIVSLPGSNWSLPPTNPPESA